MVYYKKCNICGEEYTTKHKRVKYCSDKCRAISNHRRRYNCLVEEPKEKKCVGCGVIFKTANPFKKYCVRECRYNSIKDVFNNFELREYILERDNYTCQKCKTQKGDVTYFHIHHKKPMYKGGKHTEENVTTLCKKCHQNEHKIF